MEYCKIFFNKSLNEITYHDIETFFKTSTKESDVIEFKSYSNRTESKSLYNPIYKSLCAFLNSNGGILIWGAPIPNSNKEVLGALTPIDIFIGEKDTLINKVTSEILPISNCIRVNIISCPEGGVICLFEVKRSDTAPHQWRDQYYMRIDGQTRVAPHHYIEALFKQIKFPELNCYVRFISKNAVFDERYKGGSILEIEVLLINRSVFQNEKFPFYQVRVYPGVILDHITMTSQGPTKIFNRFREILPYSFIHKMKHYVAINETDLVLTNFKITLSISFGGELSPLKSSEYFLDLTSVNHNDIFGSCVKEYHENEFLSEKYVRLGSNFNYEIKKHLGR